MRYRYIYPMNEDPKMSIVAMFGSHARLRSNALKAPHGSFKSQMYELASTVLSQLFRVSLVCRRSQEGRGGIDQWKYYGLITKMLHSCVSFQKR